MSYFLRTRYCRFCGDSYHCGKAEAKDGFCCDWCRVTFFRLCRPVLRKLLEPGSISSKVRYKSRAKRQKKFDTGRHGGY